MKLKFITMAIKDLRLFIRDRQGLFFTFAMPLIFVTVFGLAFSGVGERSNVAIVQLENNEFSENYRLALSQAFEPFDVQTLDETTAYSYLGEGKVVALVIISPNFSENNPAVLFYYDQGKQTSADNIQSVLNDTNQELFGQQTPVATKSFITEAASSSFQSLVPGFGIMFVLMIGGISGGERVLRERERGTFKRNLLAPIGRSSFLGGKLLCGLVIGCLQFLLFFGVGILVFGMQIMGSPWLLALIGALVIAFGVGLGLLVTAFVRSSDAILGAVMALILPMCALSGIWWPVGIMPGYMQSIGQVLPTYHGQQAFTNVIVEGKGLADIASPLLVLVGFVIAVFVIGVLLFKWRE